MVGRKVGGAVVAAAPLMYLVGLNIGQIGRLGSAIPLAPLGPGEAWVKAGLHLVAFLGVPLLGFWIAVGNRGVRNWAATVRAGTMERSGAMRATGLLSLVLLGATLAGVTTTTTRHGVFSLETSAAAFAGLPFHSALALSFAAAVSEEVLFRGLMMRTLMRRTAPAFAIGAQATVFGAIHLAYGSPVHALMATAFGVILAVVALRAGLAASILLHLEVNLVLLAAWSLVQSVVPVALAVFAGGVALLAWSSRARPGTAPAQAPAAS